MTEFMDMSIEMKIEYMVKKLKEDNDMIVREVVEYNSSSSEEEIIEGILNY